MKSNTDAISWGAFSSRNKGIWRNLLSSVFKSRNFFAEIIVSKALEIVACCSSFWNPASPNLDQILALSASSSFKHAGDEVKCSKGVDFAKQSGLSRAEKGPMTGFGRSICAKSCRRRRVEAN